MKKESQALDEVSEKLADETRHDIKKLEDFIDSMTNLQDQQQYSVLLGKS